MKYVKGLGLQNPWYLDGNVKKVRFPKIKIQQQSQYLMLNHDFIKIIKK